ncbi:MAG: tRNA nucleotidyltransferase [Caldithrix sp. RBG_13_44_9]|nr:MAG: tRNA nucleotidyltransferase [Caldithrix sp. RBG_13_44_9]
MLILKVKNGKKILEKTAQLASQLKMEVFTVGGFVRDLYLGQEGTDIDFVVLGDAMEFAQAFQKQFRSGKVVTYPRFGTAMLHYRDYKLEFVTARSEHYDSRSRKPRVKKADLQSDLTRRDFTINTLALDITPAHFGRLINLLHGQEDIDSKIIKTPLDPAVTFSDDPLRILRAIRFATVLDFQIESNTYQAILDTRQRLEIISQERITEELRRMLLADQPSRGIYLMKETGILDIILPELTLLAGVDQRQDFHHKDVFDHTLQVLDNISPKTDSFELRMAALLHDIAKPQTKRFVENIGWTFHGHEDLGARIVGEIGKRMRLPLISIKYLQKLVRLHLRPMQLVDDSVTDSALRRLMVEAGAELEDLMLLCRADITSKNPLKVKRYLTNFDHVEKKMKEVEERDKLREFKLAIDGNVIMKTLDIQPGPTVGKIKDAIFNAVMEGLIPNQEEACFQYMLTIKDDYLKEIKKIDSE